MEDVCRHLQDSDEKKAILASISKGDFLVISAYTLSFRGSVFEYTVYKRWVIEVQTVKTSLSEDDPFLSLRSIILSETIDRISDSPNLWERIFVWRFLMSKHVRVLPVPWEELPLYAGLGRTSYRYGELLSGSSSLKGV
ncbi:MAG: hypothetical protein GF334_05450 [Candidatus Altiarchaeales archaeon]|nr:hypothetical protein [Candidatus Altiarchaeales archaeon]